MAVGAHVELSPLAEAVPDSFCDDSSEASDIVVSGPVSTACEAADADGKMDARHAAAAMAAEGTTSEQLRHEAARCVALGGPISLQYIFGFGSSVISLIFVGHLGTFEMSAAVLGTSFSNVSGFALMAGLSSALETLCGQAYGARHYEMVGVSLQRGLLICLTAFLVLLPVWLNFEPLMIAMGQQPDLAAGASRYLRLSIPSIFFQGAFSCVSKYLTAQSIVNPQTYCTTATIVLSPLFNWLLIYQSGLGLDGAAIANVLVTMVEAVMLLGFMVHREQRSARSSESTWHGWSLQAFTGWWGYLCLAAPSAAMVVVEWSTFEIMVLLAGLLPNPELATATMGWLLNICTIVYLLPLALSGAASTRVSNALGANRPSAARIAALTAVLLTMVVTGSLAVAVLATRRQLGHIFSTDAAVIALGASVLPIISCAFVGDGVNAALGGEQMQ